MKSFNFFIIFIALGLIVAAFLLLKDGFSKSQKESNLDKSSNRVLMDLKNYRDYSESNLALSQKNGKTLLFFAALRWCVNCVVLDKEIKERAGELPRNTTILKVDYDNDKKMKSKHKVTMQSTLILLDENDSELDRWVGGNFDLILEKIKDV
ncbi:MAG: thioredoxin family protein [Candidatus Levybacteria bacterium]|nr:thioredoxin family protein [Candidatus Levybacteria bacterium]